MREGVYAVPSPSGERVRVRGQRLRGQRLRSQRLRG
jgi:hypothetical protein